MKVSRLLLVEVALRSGVAALGYVMEQLKIAELRADGKRGPRCLPFRESI